MPPSTIDSVKYAAYTSSDKLKSSSPNTADKETIIVFDWDDTLLASSFLSSKGYRLDTDKSRLVDVEGGLRDLEQAIIAVITLALQYGEVHIVTNAETGWVQLSAAKFIPAVVPLLHRVSILSARSTYEGRYPDAPLKWKSATTPHTHSNHTLAHYCTRSRHPCSLVSLLISTHSIQVLRLPGQARPLFRRAQASEEHHLIRRQPRRARGRPCRHPWLPQHSLQECKVR